jgi:hypothetical protein
MSTHDFTLALFFLACPLAAQETTITRAALPPAVERTVAEQSKGATIRGFSKEIEHGQTLYEVELNLGGRTKDVTIDSTGVVVLVEEEVPLDSLPPGVMQGITAQAGESHIALVERLMKGGRLVAYEAHVKRNGKTAEIQVGPNGEKLDHEE